MSSKEEFEQNVVPADSAALVEKEGFVKVMEKIKSEIKERRETFNKTTIGVVPVKEGPDQEEQIQDEHIPEEP